MANDNVVGKVMIILELPDEGIRRPQLPGESNPNILKSVPDIINEIVRQAVSTTDWTSTGLNRYDTGLTKLSLVYEGV